MGTSKVTKKTLEGNQERYLVHYKTVWNKGNPEYLKMQ